MLSRLSDVEVIVHSKEDWGLKHAPVPVKRNKIWKYVTRRAVRDANSRRILFDDRITRHSLLKHFAHVVPSHVHGTITEFHYAVPCSETGSLNSDACENLSEHQIRQVTC